MRHSAIARRAARLTLGAAAVAAAACSRSEQPKVPLAEATQAQSANPHDALPPDARTAIDSGNAEYRAGHYDAALGQYRLATKAAPENAAPYFGVYMVAKKLNKPALADSAMEQIRAHATGAGKALTDSSMAKMHTDSAAMREHATAKAKG